MHKYYYQCAHIPRSIKCHNTCQFKQNIMFKYIYLSSMTMTFNFQANIPFVLGTPALPSTFNAILNATANALYALSALW